MTTKLIQAFHLNLQRLRVWRGQSVNRRIFAAALIVGTFTVGAKLTTVAKDLLIASEFGTGDRLEAFLIAFILPSFTINVVAGSFNAAFVPTYIQIREQEGAEAAQRLFSNVTVWSLALLSAVCVVLATTGPFILSLLAPLFGPEKLALTCSLLYVLLPVIIVSGLGTVWAGVLNAGERFALAAIIPIITPIITILTLIMFGKNWHAYSLAAGALLGAVLEAGILGWQLQRRGLSIVPHWYGLSPALRQVIKQYAPMIAGAALMSSTVLVDQSMATWLGSGSVAVLSYANKLTALILTIGSMAIGTAVLPYFSRMVGKDDWAGIKHTLITYTKLILLISVPLTVLLILFSEPIIRLAFERGAFTPSDTHIVAQVQICYLLQMPFYLLGTLLVRLISSMRGNQILMLVAIISLIVNIALDVVFISFIGVAGIALSTVFVYLISVCFLLYMLHRMWGKHA